jgi:hypothetical protein
MKMTTPIPAQITTPDEVDTRLGTLRFFDGFPDDHTVEKVMDNLDFSRGVQAFLSGMPGASLVGMRAGFQKLGVLKAASCFSRISSIPNLSSSRETRTPSISARG